MRIGTHPDGSSVNAYRIAAHGLTAEVMTHGAGLRRLVPDGGASLVLGFPDYADYLDRGRHFGMIVGRFANRISGARIEVDGVAHDLDANALGRHTLHGGSDGTGARNWRLDLLQPDRLVLTDDLPAGHMGFPGRLQVSASYAIEPGPALAIQITAQADAPTPCSFAQHSYFNLTGAPDITDHLLRVDADRFLPLDPDKIPTGEIASVAGTRADFRRFARLGDRIAQGFGDDPLCLSDQRLACRPVAWLQAPGATQGLQIDTTEPGLQVYTGAHFGHGGLALEPQAWPDAPNRPNFPDTILRPGQIYHQITRIRVIAPQVDDRFLL